MISLKQEFLEKQYTSSNHKNVNNIKVIGYKSQYKSTDLSVHIKANTVIHNCCKRLVKAKVLLRSNMLKTVTCQTQQMD